MENFDLLVIGAGSGMIVASNAVASGLKTALVESGPMGETCLNRARMAFGDKTFEPIARAMHIHPALPEFVQRAFDSLREA